MTTATPTRQTTKLVRHIHDFHELESAIVSQLRPTKDSPVSQALRENFIKRRGTDLFAQLDDRTFAYGNEDCIRLAHYGRDKSSCSSDIVEQHHLQDMVSIYPAASGRTTYRIDKRIETGFRRRMLPGNFKRSRRGGADYLWFSGQSQVYVSGEGPMYPDAGPAFMHDGPEATLGKICASENFSDAFKDAAAELLKSVAELLSPFRDLRIRYEICDRDEEFGPGMFVERRCDGWHGLLQIPYQAGLRVRLKSPATQCGQNPEWTPDFSICMAGQALGVEYAPDVSYGAELLWPHGRHSHHVAGSNSRQQREQFEKALPPLSAYLAPDTVLQYAQQWAADHVYIPAT